jgi:hypothetical protein
MIIVNETNKVSNSDILNHVKIKSNKKAITRVRSRNIEMFVKKFGKFKF